MRIKKNTNWILLQWLQKMLWIIILSSIRPVSEASEPGAALESFLKRASSFQAEFHQVLLNESGNSLEESKGVFSLQRPGKFRWDYQEPFSQTIVADGSRIWFYDPDLEQVTVKKQSLALGSTPALLLSGERLPKEDFKINDLPPHDNLVWVELLPLDKDASFDRLLLGFGNGNLSQMELHDSFGQTTRLSFSKVKIDLSFDPSLFIFTPPVGADVVGDITP